MQITKASGKYVMVNPNGTVSEIGMQVIEEPSFYKFLTHTIEKIDIPSGTTEILDMQFVNQTALTSVTIPSTVTVIGMDAFHGCTNLQSLTIPSSVTSLGARFYYGQTLIMQGTTPPSLYDIQSTTANIYVPDAAVDTYKSATGWSNYASKIKGISQMN